MSRGRRPRVALVMGKCATGGIKSYILGVLGRLPPGAFDVEVIAYEGFEAVDAEPFRELGASVASVAPASRPLAFASSLAAELRRGGFDVCHGLLNTLNPLAMVAARMAGVPVRIAENLSTGHPGEAKSAVKALLKPIAALGATDLAANSRLAAEWLYGRRSGEAEIVMNPVDLDYYRPDPAERARVRSGLGLGDGFTVGWIGRYAPQKNPVFLPDVLAALLEREPGARMLAVGYGPLETRVRERAEALGVSSRLLMLPATEDIRPLYRAMDVFVLPSLYEGLPVVAVEAQACGLPCVLSSEVTREAAAGEGVPFVGLRDGAAAWADALLALRGLAPLDNRAALEAAGFSAEGSARRLADLWGRCLAREGVS